MTKVSEPAEGVHRLLDIVAEEVSLVDHAANLRRFLIVKRSDPMADPQPEPQPNPGPDSPELDPGAPVIEELDSANEDLVDAALAVLERLTETVETLSVLADGDAREALGEIAAALRSLADELVGAAGGPEPVAAAAPTSVGAPTADQVAALITSVRGALANVGTLIAEAKAARRKPPPPASEPAPQDKRAPVASPTAAPAATPSETEAVRTELAALTAAVTKLTETTKGQLQRLAQLEKRFGLPNSTPTREASTPTATEEIGWPLDLNRPFDRESVDKSVSFHTVD